jgi:hypothetical protein
VIRVTFRVGTLKLTSEDTPRLERAVTRMRADTREALLRMKDVAAARRRFRDLLLRETERAFLDG